MELESTVDVRKDGDANAGFRVRLGRSCRGFVEVPCRINNP